jgi:hypothetical protein
LYVGKVGGKTFDNLILQEVPLVSEILVLHGEQLKMI